jgi:DNA-directed RNA polymerase beta subunit
MDNRVPSVQPARPIAETAERVRELVLCHVESFNYMLEEGIQCAVDDIPAREVVLEHPAEGEAGAGGAVGAGAAARATPGKAAGGRKGASAGSGGAAAAPAPAPASDPTTIRFWLEEPRFSFPTHKAAASDARLFPWQAREAGVTYAAALSATLCRSVNGGSVDKFPVKLGDAPVMVRSSRCHLAGLSPQELTERNEEQVEAGGYFICNGIERIVRILQVLPEGGVFSFFLLFPQFRGWLTRHAPPQHNHLFDAPMLHLYSRWSQLHVCELAHGVFVFSQVPGG